MSKNLIIPTFLAFFISIVRAQTVDESSLVPISKIGGTNLYTGVYYKMSMKTFPYGWVTSAWYQGRTYVQIELNPSELPNYEPGKTKQYDNQWYFDAVDTKAGYTLTNRMKSDGVLSYAGWYAAISNKADLMASGDKYLIAAQWKLKGTSENDYYKVESVQYPGCLLTWTFEKYNSYNYYILMTYKDYKDDLLFSFKLPTITLKANVTDFRFHQLQNETDKALVGKKIFPNTNKTDFSYLLNETHQTTNSFTFSFDKPIQHVSQTTITVNNLLDLSTTELTFHGAFEANEGRSIEVAKDLTLTSHVRVPPYSETEVSIYTIRSKVEVPFTATLILSGTTERILKDQTGQFQEAQVPADLIAEYLRHNGENNLEIVSVVGNSLHILVKGFMKANVGYKANFESTTLTKEPPKTSNGFFQPIIVKTLSLAIGK